MKKLLITLVALFAWSFAFAGEQCALESGESYASKPETGQTPQPGPVRIKKGQRYAVGPTEDGWSKVQHDGDFVWARAAMFAYSCNPTTGRVGTHQAPKSLESARSLSSSPNVSGCACSSGRVCVGPRGGRYCITSGGNKRYGV